MQLPPLYWFTLLVHSTGSLYWFTILGSTKVTTHLLLKTIIQYNNGTEESHGPPHVSITVLFSRHPQLSISTSLQIIHPPLPPSVQTNILGSQSRILCGNICCTLHKMRPVSERRKKRRKKRRGSTTYLVQKAHICYYPTPPMLACIQENVDI